MLSKVKLASKSHCIRALGHGQVIPLRKLSIKKGRKMQAQKRNAQKRKEKMRKVSNRKMKAAFLMKILFELWRWTFVRRSQCQTTQTRCQVVRTWRWRNRLILFGWQTCFDHRFQAVYKQLRWLDHHVILDGRTKNLSKSSMLETWKDSPWWRVLQISTSHQIHKTVGSEVAVEMHPRKPTCFGWFLVRRRGRLDRWMSQGRCWSFDQEASD